MNTIPFYRKMSIVCLLIISCGLTLQASDQAETLEEGIARIQNQIDQDRIMRNHYDAYPHHPKAQELSTLAAKRIIICEHLISYCDEIAANSASCEISREKEGNFNTSQIRLSNINKEIREISSTL